MSWDAFLIKGPKPSDQDFKSNNYRLPEMGRRKEIVAKIIEIFPEIKTQSDTSLVYQKGKIVIEINVRCKGDQLVQLIDISVHGYGDLISVISQLCKANGWEAFDMQTAEFIDMDTPNSDSWTKFLQFYDR